MKIQKFVLFVKKKIGNKYLKDKKYKVRDHCHYTGEYRAAAHSSVPNKIPTVFHNGSN